MAQNLVRKGAGYYFKIAIPRPLRHLFLGKAGNQREALWERLGFDRTTATIKCAERVAYWTRVFARLQAGESLDDAQQAEKFSEFSRVQRVVRAGRAFGMPDAMLRNIVESAALDDPKTDYSSILGESLAPSTAPLAAAPAPAGSETVSQAAAALFEAMARDGRRQTTVDGHKLRVRAFVAVCGDIPLASITRATASDWLDRIGAERSNRTRNAYAMTMALVIETARRRGRYQGENPFDGMKAQASGDSYQAFTESELATLFRALPRDVKPAKHSPETALPWVTLIAAYTGMRLEEIAQLSVADVREQKANGATITVIDIHNSGNNAIKNRASIRLVPVHSELVRAGFLDYVRALPQNGPLFPGLVRRQSKGGKLGARLGELFRRKLIALNLKRAGLVFHSLRHNVATRLEQAGVAQTDAARVLGHAIEGMSYGVYSTGPGLKRLAAVVEEIHFDNI